MTQKIKVLFAVDFKDGCKHAMRELMKIARQRPMEITLLHVFNDHFFSEREFLFPESQEKLEKAKDGIKQKLEDKLGDWAVEVMGPSYYQARVEFGDPGELFSKYAEEFDLLVIGANKHNLIDRFFMNSVAENILGRTHMPTLILRQGMDTFKEATVLVDLADDAKSYIAEALDSAREMGIEKLTFLSYYPVPIEVASYSIHSASALPEKEIKELVNQLKSGLEGIVKSYGSKLQYDVVIKKAPSSSLASNIAEDLEKSNGLIMLGRRRRSALSEFFLGSVALSVLRATKCDIVILPLKD